MSETGLTSSQTYTTQQYSGFELKGFKPSKSNCLNLEMMYEEMMRVQNEKVGYFKKAIFELQRQNAMLINELVRHKKECNDISEQKMSNTLKDPKEICAEGRGDCKNVEDLKQKITELEEELKHHQIMVQRQDLQVKSLLKSRQKLTDSFEKKLMLLRKKATSELQAILLEERARHLLNQADQGIERANQFETYISTLYEKFQGILLDSQAKNSQSRHDDLQRITELEQKLSSVTLLL